MNKESSRLNHAAQKSAGVERRTLSRFIRLGLIAALFVSFSLYRPENPHAQQRYKEPVVNITNVVNSGSVISILADGSLNRAQTWQDSEGFHIILVNGQAAPSVSARGVRVRRVGNSLELVVAVKTGASVTVHPRGNRLDLVVRGGGGGALNVENFPSEASVESKPKARAEEPAEQRVESYETRAPQAASKRRNAAESAHSDTLQPPASAALQTPKSELAAAQPINVSTGAQPATAPVASGEVQDASKAQAEANEQLIAGEDAGSVFFGMLFSLPGLLGVLGLVLLAVALVVVRRRRNDDGFEDVEPLESEKPKKSQTRDTEESSNLFKVTRGDRRKVNIAVPFERRKSGRGSEDLASRELRLDAGAEGKNDEQRERGLQPHGASASKVAVQFGAYRIDQEVSRLVVGDPHSIEVLAARATDDRRAVEASLLKALRDRELDEDGRRRVRMALEDYGFVAHACAALLLGAENYERASAARTLGEMMSSQALPFLMEALYDHDPVVRMECVHGLGALGLPSAIGALLDVARRHPDIPASVLGPALTACSVESLELNWEGAHESRTFADMGDEEFTGDIRVLEPVMAEVEELPEWIEDETLQSALEKLSSAEVESRVHSARQLAQFQVRRAVDALAAIAQDDTEAAVRSAAVTSLGQINHESVFVHVIIALADDAREVRAAAARALSRLSFDRADAYVRVIESSDSRMLRQVAHACVKAGLAAQAISRLASEDRRQAYEAFSLLSLVARAGETQPILDTIECSRDIEVRLVCIRLLDLSAQPQIVEQLLRIADNGGVPERVRRTILEAVERVEQLQPAVK
jgi:HEAT repeat protein